MRRVLLVALAAVIVASGCNRDEFLEVQAVFSDVGDLAPLAQVQAADVRIGTVRRIRLDGYRARATLSIRRDANMPENAIAVVRQTSLLGERLVELKVPEGEIASTDRLKDGAVIPMERTRTTATLDEAFIKLGDILQNGNIADLATVISASAEIVRDRQTQLGQVFEELKKVTGVLSARSTDIGAAVDSFDQAFAAFSQGSEALTRSISSSADATQILADQQQDLDRLVAALDRFAAVNAQFSTETQGSNDRALKDLRLILDQVMTKTDALDQSLAALARFMDLWPRVIPSDYVQLDVVSDPDNSGPTAAVNSASQGQPTGHPTPSNLQELLMRPSQ